MLTIHEKVDLKPHNTFGITAVAKYFTTLHTEDEARELIQSEIFKREKHLFIGGGSNLLLTNDFDGLVIKILIMGIKTVKEDDDVITLKVGAGENWHSFVMYCVERNLGGLENLSLIPGTVGAAPMQNIGAYGAEVKNNIYNVAAINISTGELEIFTNSQCNFGYRESIFKQSHKGKYIISSVTFTVTKKNHQFKIKYGALEETLKQQGVHEVTLRAISDAVIHIRQLKLPDPKLIGNAGSFFKNPSIHNELYDFIKKQYPTIPSYPAENNLVKIPAAWLIEQCGWKGKTFNNIGVHKDQALVIVNYGGGKGQDIWQLAMNIQASVSEKFNIILQPEVNVV